MKRLGAVIFVAAFVSGTTLAQSTNSEAPAVESAVAPVFPPIAAAANVSGEVIVEVEVNEKGEVRAARSVNAHPLLRKASEDAAFRWRFTPDLGGGKNRAVRLTFSYRLVRLKAPAAELASIFMPPYSVEVRREKFATIIHSDPPSYTIPPKRVRKRRKSE